MPPTLVKQTRQQVMTHSALRGREIFSWGTPPLALCDVEMRLAAKRQGIDLSRITLFVRDPAVAAPDPTVADAGVEPPGEEVL